jgi:glucosamine-6-phosphate isomerase
MNIFIADTPASLALHAADELVRKLGAYPAPLLCPASGDTPAALYRELTGRVARRELDTGSWWFVGLDEWAGMNGKDEGSCRWHLDRQFFHPMAAGEERIQFFDGRAGDLERECTATENFIRQKGGIGLAVIGLGLNGHVAMNEPGVSPSARSHIAAIHPDTQQVGQKYFSGCQDLSRGITLGIATLLEARHIFLLVTGAHKAAIVKEVLEGNITDRIPGTLLRDHPGLNVYLDRPAAQFLTTSVPAELPSSAPYKQDR